MTHEYFSVLGKNDRKSFNLSSYKEIYVLDLSWRDCLIHFHVICDSKFSVKKFHHEYLAGHTAAIFSVDIRDDLQWSAMPLEAQNCRKKAQLIAPCGRALSSLFGPMRGCMVTK